MQLTPFLVVLALCGLDSVSSLKCYQCSTTSDARCLDPTAEGSNLKPTECKDIGRSLLIGILNIASNKEFNYACSTMTKYEYNYYVVKKVLVTERKCVVDTRSLEDKSKPPICELEFSVETKKNQPVVEVRDTNLEECNECYTDGCNTDNPNEYLLYIFAVVCLLVIISLIAGLLKCICCMCC